MGVRVSVLLRVSVCLRWHGCGTWMRLLPQSATMMLPLLSTATPVGALNCPLPSPCDPNLNRNSPSALYTWWAGGTTRGSHGGHCSPPALSALGGSQQLPVAPLTFTEWLWKSVTTISFLLLTATKWGPEETKGAQPKWGTGNSSPGLASQP